MPKSTLCLPPARWEPRALDSECSGNIARFWWISSNHVKTRLFIQISNPTPTMPVCLGPKAPDFLTCNGNIASFRRISSNLTKTRLSLQIYVYGDLVSWEIYNLLTHLLIYTDLIVIRHLNAKIHPLSPTCSLRTRDPCSGNIAWFRWNSFNFIKTWLSIQM